MEAIDDTQSISYYISLWVAQVLLSTTHQVHSGVKRSVTCK